MNTNIPNIYNDPIISKKRKGSAIDPFKEITESIMIEKYYALLTEIPNRLNKVRVKHYGKELYEVKDEKLTEDTFRVDYTNGIVYFHGKWKGETLDFEYVGEGVFLFPDSRIYLTEDPEFANARDKFRDIDRGLLEQKNRVDTLIIETPQPSEVVDIRIDRNGKVFPVARDRINSEQKKIEDAYVDANDKKYPSLKARIDSLQLATEEKVDEIEEVHTDLWASLDLVPGQITAEVGKLSEKVNGDMELLKASIDLVPEQITIAVEELHETIDGELDSVRSTIKLLSNEMEFKVDVDGVVNSINISEEGVAIDGSKVKITGETHIDDAVIKSAHIDSLDANKIKAGVLSSMNENTRFDLNTGNLEMGNADLELGGGADVHFLDSGNKLYFQRVDPIDGRTRSAGVGFGININSRFPFAYLGASNRSRPAALDAADFTGFVANTRERMIADGIGNSVVGHVFHIRDEVVSYSKGFRFDLAYGGGRISMSGLNTGTYNYDLGSPSSRFSRVYTDHIRGDSIYFNYHASGSDLGYVMEMTLSEVGDPETRNRNPAFRPQYGGSLYYDLGTSYHVWRHGYINVLHYNSLRQNSLRRFKEDFNDLDPKDAIEYIKNTEVHTFYYKNEDDKPRTKYDLKVGIIHDDINIKKDYLVKSSDTTVDMSNIVYLNQAAVKNLIERVEKLEEENQYLRSKIS